MKNFYKNKKILIMGGLGFIGENLASKLTNLGSNVTIIERNSEKGIGVVKKMRRS